MDGGDAGVPLVGRCDEGGGTKGYRDVYTQASEHCGAVHSYWPHYGPMTGYGDYAGIADTGKVVGSGRPGLIREYGGGTGVWIWMPKRRGVWGWGI